MTTSGSNAVPPIATRSSASTKSLDVGHPVLEQVADAGGVVGQEIGGIAGLDVLGEEQDAETLVLGPQLEGQAQALVGEGRRHADVDHRHVGRVLRDGAAQRGRVTDGAGDHEAAVHQELHQAVAEDGRVLRDGDPQCTGHHGDEREVDGDDGRAAPGADEREPAVDGVDAVREPGEATGRGAQPGELAPRPGRRRARRAAARCPAARTRRWPGRRAHAGPRWRGARPRRSRRSPRWRVWVAARRSTVSSVGTALRAARVASAPSSPMSRAGGWMPRAMSRSSAMASLAPRCASSTSSRTRTRSTSSASSSFSLAMPRRMASATSWAWVPSCRSRSIRRSVAAEASTVWVLACSSVRTRAAIGSGPSSAADHQAVDVDEAAHDPGRREEKDEAEDEDGEAVEEALAVEHEEVPGRTRSAPGPRRGARLRSTREGAEEAGERVPPQAERHEETEHRPGHLEGEVADGPPADPVPQGRLQPPEEPVPPDERLGVLDVLAEHGAGQAPAPARRSPAHCGRRARGRPGRRR